MKIFLSGLIVIFAFFLTSQVFGQSADHLEGCAPLEVSFKAENVLTEYFWDFKAGVISKEKDPTKTFIDAGTYDVELREGENGRFVGTVRIIVYAKPNLVADITPLEGCIPLSVDFKADRSTIDPRVRVNKYHWTFGDGAGMDGQNARHLYSDDGIFNIALQIESDVFNCSITKIFTDTVEVFDTPTAKYLTKPGVLTICEPPVSINFTNTTTGKGTLDYAWDYGDGSTSDQKDPPDKVFTKTGRFKIKLTVTNEKGCKNDFSRTLNIGKPLILLPLPDTICLDQEFIFTNRSSQGRYAWTFEGGIPEQSPVRNPIVVFNTPGAHTVTLTITSLDRRCQSDTSFQIFVEDPSAVFTTIPSYSCSEPFEVQFRPANQSALSYEWLFPDSTTSNERNPVFTIDDPTETIYTKNGLIYFWTQLIITTKSNCRDTFIKADTVFLPNARFMPNQSKGCIPLDVIFADSSHSKEDIVSWEWDYGDGQTATFNNGDDHNHIYTQPGEYWVQLIVVNALGCRDTSYQVLIEAGDKVNPDFTVDKTVVCPGEPVSFTSLNNDPNIDGWHYYTDDGRSFHCFQDSILSWSYINETGLMDVELEVEYNGCYSSILKKNLIEVKGPIAQIDYLVECDRPFDYAFSDSSRDATVLTWDFGDTTMSNEGDVLHTYENRGEYTVILKAENPGTGCPASIDSVTVYVKQAISRFTLDTNLCDGIQYDLIADSSQDAATRCLKGYTWLFSRDRPLTTAKDTQSYTFVGNEDWTVSLEVEDINGCRDTSSIDVHIFQVRPDFTMDDERICIPADVQFTDISTADTTIVEWKWTFPDGTMVTDQNPQYRFNTFMDTGFVVLLVEDEIGCSDTYFKPITMYKPETKITTKPRRPFVCEGSLINFVAKDFTREGSSLDFSWDFGNGETGSNMDETVQYNKDGVYRVVMTGTEKGSGCQVIETVEVQVQAPPVADFISTMDPDTVGCANSIVRFNSKNSPGGTPIQFRTWDLGNGVIVKGQPFVENSFEKGVYEIELIVESSFGCKDTIRKSYEFIGPEGDFISDNDTICAGDEILLSLADTADVDRWVWEINGRQYNNVNPITNEIFVTDNRDSSNVILKLYKDECELTVSNPIFFHRVVADFDTLPTCIGAKRFDNLSEGADLFEWDFGDGTNSTRKYPVHEFTTEGVYQIGLKVQGSKFGCRDSIIQSLIVFPNPGPDGVDTLFCEFTTGILTILNETGSSKYTWYDQNNQTLLEDMTDTLSGQDNYVFYLEEVDKNGCTGRDSVFVDLIRDLNIPDFDTTVCVGVDVALPAMDPYGYYNYRWKEKVGDCADCKDPVFSAVQTDSFTLFYADEMGCFDNEASFKIIVPDGDLEFPLAFSPNGDGSNDYFNVISKSPLDESSIKRFDVYNRWGEKVYNNSVPNRGWDGNYKGNAAVSEVYIYIFELQLSGCSFIVKGDVTLVR